MPESKSAVQPASIQFNKAHPYWGPSRAVLPVVGSPSSQVEQREKRLLQWTDLAMNVKAPVSETAHIGALLSSRCVSQAETGLRLQDIRKDIT